MGRMGDMYKIAKSLKREQAPKKLYGKARPNGQGRVRVNSKEYGELVESRVVGMLNYLTDKTSEELLTQLRQEFTLSNKRFFRIMGGLVKQGVVAKRCPGYNQFLWRLVSASVAS